MQIGTRWRAGAPAPASVPATVAARVALTERDAQLTGDWTLTWLEGRAVATHACGIRIVETPDGEARVLAPGETEHDDDDWLS